jgi:hypothetical protein
LPENSPAANAVFIALTLAFTIWVAAIDVRFF